MFTLIHRCYEALPSGLKALIDYTFFSDRLLNTWGGPLNGQAHRQLMVRQIVEGMAPACIVETGTFRGRSTRFFSELTSNTVATVETDRQYFLFAKWSLKNCKNVKLFHLDSVEFLNRISQQRQHVHDPVFFYLDAHWRKHLPLREELDIIFSNFENPVVLIDDFAVPADPGYGYDNYGNDKALNLRYIASLKHYDFSIFFPSVSSDQETGYKRGSVVVARGSRVIEALHGMPSIRFHGTSTHVFA